MGKLATAKKVVSKVSNVATTPVEASAGGKNNLLLLAIIIILWMYLFFKGSKTGTTAKTSNTKVQEV